MGTRIISLMLAVLFFVSTVGFSIYVIIEANREDDNQVNSALDTSDTLNGTGDDIPGVNNQTEDTNVLKGTTLTGFEPSSVVVEELQIIDTVEGTGDVVKAGANVTVHYTGATVRDGVIFESSRDSGNPITFGLEGLIQGWQEGIPGMKVGGTRRLVIPAEKAYGAFDPNSDRPTGDLVFDIELIGITE